MRRLIAAAAILLVALTVGAEMGSVSRHDAGRYMMQPTGHYRGSLVSYTDSVWNVIDRDSTRVWGKGILVSDTSAGGWLWLHLVDDADTVWFVWYFSGGDQEGFVFDKIHQPRSTTDTLPRRDFVVAQ